MNILVTGSMGFIGTRLIDELIEEHRVYALDKRANLAYQLNRNHNPTYIKCDLSDPYCGLFLPKEIDIIFHLASQQPSIPGLTFSNFLNGNLITTRNLLEFYKDQNVKCFIYTSTIASSNKDYLITKRFAENLINGYSTHFGFDPIILNLAPVIGKGHKGGFVYDFYKKAKANKDIYVYGRGEPLKCLIHVDEVVRALMKVLDIIMARDVIDNFNSLNICTPEHWSLKSIARYIIKMLDSKSQIILSDRLASEIKGSINESRNYLGFSSIGIMASLHKYINEMEAKP